ncbi:MAG: hypothetical protein RLZZ573_1463 [Pseudomonadota bacterium]|jgi:AcrR family transcriptional regulator
MTTNLTRKEQSHARIVEVAARAIRRAGYRGVGVADIMKEAGFTHGGFYAHFASRDALLVEAMQQASRDNQSALSDSMARRMAKGHSRFSALVWAYLHDTHLAQAENGCVVAALASETTRQGDAVQQEAKRRVIYLVEFVRSALPEGAEREQAEVITATMVGALQLARTLGGTAGRALLAQTREALILKHQPVSAS